LMQDQQKEKHFEKVFDRIMYNQISTSNSFLQPFEIAMKRIFNGMEEQPIVRGSYVKKEKLEILKNWLLEHQSHPYPTNQETKEISKKTGMTQVQIKIWMANGRKRFLGGKIIPPNVKRVKLFSEELEKKFTNDQ
jgi:hypothetical protein